MVVACLMRKATKNTLFKANLVFSRWYLHVLRVDTNYRRHAIAKYFLCYHNFDPAEFGKAEKENIIIFPANSDTATFGKS